MIHRSAKAACRPRVWHLPLTESCWRLEGWRVGAALGMVHLGHLTGNPESPKRSIVHPAMRMVSLSSTQTVAGSARTLVPAGRGGTVKLVVHGALRGSRRELHLDGLDWR